MAIDRVRISLTGFAGAPGVMTFYCLDAISARSPFGIFVSNILALLPTDVTIQLENTGDRIDELTGDIIGDWAVAESAANLGQDASGYSGVSGALCVWHTAGIVNSHRVRGRTFIVPGGGGLYDTDGTLRPGARTVTSDAAAALVTDMAGNLVVWSRPFAGRPAVGTKKAIAARVGSRHLVLSSSVPDKAVVLRSRRD